jgi:hypothetical protein
MRVAEIEEVGIEEKQTCLRRSLSDADVVGGLSSVVSLRLGKIAMNVFHLISTLAL